MEMVSGAGHDSLYLAKVVPTSMIFVPCKDGLSHNEAEYAKPEDLTAGANVLLNNPGKQCFMSITRQICCAVLRPLVIYGGLFCPSFAHELAHHGNIRHLVEFDTEFQNINRVLTAGYPDSLGLFAFWGRHEPETVSIDDKVCQKANFFAPGCERMTTCTT